MRLFLCLPLLLIGCESGTTLYNPRTGGKLASFRADMDRSSYRGGGVTWDVENHRPSRNTTARGNAVAKVVRTGSEGAQTFIRP